MAETIKDLLVILIGSSLVSNVVLSQFLGLCPFLGVSKKSRYSSWYGWCSCICHYSCQCGGGSDL